MARKKLEEVGRQGSAAQLGENKDTSVVSPERSVASAADHEESDVSGWGWLGVGK